MRHFLPQKHLFYFICASAFLSWTSFGDEVETQTNTAPLFIIKNYEGRSMAGFLMHTFHEEMMNILGENDIAFSNQNNLAEYFTNKYGKLPDGIVFFWDFTPTIYEKIRSQLPNTKIILWTDDLHWYDAERYSKNLFSFKNADIHLSHYNYFQMFYGLNIDHKVIRMPHSCGMHFSKSKINENAVQKIYFYGSTTSAHYRLRNWFINEMKAKFPDRLVVKQHPGYDGDKEQESIATGNELYGYSFAYTAGAFPSFEIKETATTPYYLVAKFLEIPGSGALLLCNDYGVREQLNQMGFYDMINYVNITETNFDARINWLFDAKNSVAIEKMRRRGHELVRDKHTTLKRIQDINVKLDAKLRTR